MLSAGASIQILSVFQNVQSLLGCVFSEHSVNPRLEWEYGHQEGEFMGRRCPKSVLA